MDKAQFDELSGKVDKLAEALGGIGETIANGVTTAMTNALKPMTDQLAANAAAQAEKDKADKAVLVNKVVKAGLLTEELANAADVSVLSALAEKAEPGTVTTVNGAFKPKDGEKSGFTAPKGE